MTALCKPMTDTAFAHLYRVQRQGGRGKARVQHPTFAAAEKEARRLLGLFPESTFYILHEVARVRMTPEPPRPNDDSPAHVVQAHADWVNAHG